MSNMHTWAVRFEINPGGWRKTISCQAVDKWRAMEIARKKIKRPANTHPKIVSVTKVYN